MANVAKIHGGRKAFGRGARRSKRTQGKIIAEAIQRHEAAGRTQWVSPTEFTDDPETVRWAMRFLGRLRAEVSQEEQERRADQQAYLDSLASHVPVSFTDLF